MYASAALQVSLDCPRCGLMQSPTVPNVALGQNLPNVAGAFPRDPDGFRLGGASNR
jgi:hypothetical protein